MLILTVLPIVKRYRELAWVKAAMRALSAAVIGVITVSLIQIAPHAAPDALTACWSS